MPATPEGDINFEVDKDDLDLPPKRRYLKLPERIGYPLAIISDGEEYEQPPRHDDPDGKPQTLTHAAFAVTFNGDASMHHVDADVWFGAYRLRASIVKAVERAMKRDKQFGVIAGTLHKEEGERGAYYLSAFPEEQQQKLSHLLATMSKEGLLQQTEESLLEALHVVDEPPSDGPTEADVSF